MATLLGQPIKILSLAFLFVFLGFTGVERHITAFFSETGMVEVGFYSLILIYLFFALSAPLSAVFVSKYGAKKCLVFASLFYSLFILSLLTKSPALIYITSVLLGIAASFLWTGQNSYLIRASDRNSYGRASGFFESSKALGSALGVLFFSFLIAIFYFELPFLIFSFFPLIGLILLLKLKDVRVEEKISRFRFLKKSLTSKTAWNLSIIWFSLHFIFGLVIGIIPLQIKDIIGLSYIGVLSSLFFILPITLAYPSGKLSDIKGRKPMIIFSYILLILGLLSLYFSKSPLLLIIGIFLLALFWTIMRTITYALVGDVSTENNLEFLTALFWMIQNIGVVGALVLSQVFKAEIAILYLISIFIMIISSITLLPLFRLKTEEIKEKISQEVLS